MVDKKTRKKCWTRRNIGSNGDLTSIYHALYHRFGPQHWWPGETPFEILVGAILTQNTAWASVSRAIDNLKHAGCLDPETLHRIGVADLAPLIRPSGYFQLKAARLKECVDYLFLTYMGDLNQMFNKNTLSLRKELLSIKGIGPETADSIILYAAQRPVFVVDAYTKRVFSRHGFFPENWGYNDIQLFFMNRLPRDVDLYNEYHALIVRLGKTYCKTRPICDQCPLAYDRIEHNGGCNE